MVQRLEYKCIVMVLNTYNVSTVVCNGGKSLAVSKDPRHYLVFRCTWSEYEGKAWEPV